MIAITLGVPATAVADGAAGSAPPATAAASGGTTAGSGGAEPKKGAGKDSGGTSYGTGTKAERRARRAARERARRARVQRQRQAAGATDGADGAAFPIQGSFSYGDGFGAPRPGGRKHQGQDMAADQGTPVVSPRAGKVTTRAYQGGGAGCYLVITDAGNDLSYVFMHLEEGSLRVGEGDGVGRGERIASVGSTGRSTGPHLHFEIWRGGWYSGGVAIDPLPYLKRWAR